MPTLPDHIRNLLIHADAVARFTRFQDIPCESNLHLSPAHMPLGPAQRPSPGPATTPAPSTAPEASGEA